MDQTIIVSSAQQQQQQQHQPTATSSMMNMTLTTQQQGTEEEGPHLLHSPQHHDNGHEENTNNENDENELENNDPYLLSFSDKTTLLFGTPEPPSIIAAVSPSHLTVSQKSELFATQKLFSTPNRNRNNHRNNNYNHTNINNTNTGSNRRGWSSTPRRRTKAAPRVALTTRSPPRGRLPMPMPLQNRSLNCTPKRYGAPVTTTMNKQQQQQSSPSLKSTPAPSPAAQEEDASTASAPASAALTSSSSKDNVSDNKAVSNSNAPASSSSSREEGTTASTRHDDEEEASSDSSRRLIMMQRQRRHSFSASTRHLLLDTTSTSTSTGITGMTHDDTDTDRSIRRVYSSPTASSSKAARHNNKPHFRDAYAALNECTNISPQKLQHIIMDNPVTKAAFLAQQTPEYRKKEKMYGTPQLAGRLGVSRFPNPPTYYVRTWTTGAELCSPSAFTSGKYTIAI
jgi:hypothetical protein